MSTLEEALGQQQANFVLLDPCNALSGAELEECPKSMVTP